MKLTVIFVTLVSLAGAQVATHANESFSTTEGRARMIGMLTSPERAKRLKAEKLVGELDLKAGETVVDLGTGPGLLLPYLEKAVGGTGRLIAEDIHQDFLDAAKRSATEAGLANVEFVLGTERSPNLPAAAADVVVTVDTYHHFNYPGPMLAGIREGLKDGGRFAIVDYYKNGFRDPKHIRADKPEVIKEVEAAGFHLRKDIEHVPGTQYMVVFEKE